MTSWNTGSVVSFVTNLAAGEVPSSISGTNMNPLVEQAGAYVETYTGVTVDLTNIPIKYQGPILDITLANVLRAIDIQEGGVNSVSLGELSLSEGGGGGNSDTADKLLARAKQQLLELGRSVRVFKVWGS